MRVLIFHGYLLSGTGSNVYNARLAQALVRLGHEVHLFSQDRHPERHPFVDAVGAWEQGALRVDRLGSVPERPGEHPPGNRAAPRPDTLREADAPYGERSVRCTVYRPDIGGLLPVYVPDRYEGVQARTFLECDERQIAAYVQANVEAVREVADLVRPEVALANHLIMGPTILARALAGIAPYAVKVHGSALEYTVKRDPQRFLAWAREGLAGASAVLVGSRHTAESLWEALGSDGGDDNQCDDNQCDDSRRGGAALRARTRMGPPGVDVERFTSRSPSEADGALHALAERLAEVACAAEPSDNSFARDERATADAVRRLADGSGPLVAFVGKLIVSKGVDLLLAAWPLVLQRVPSARLAVIGFGAYRDGLERLLGALERGNLDEARRIAVAGHALEAAPDASTGRSADSRPLRHLMAFIDSLGGSEREAYLAAAGAMAGNVVLTGRLEHDELAEVLPACEVLVVPSTFPEAFGMVAAEAAACGVAPVSARHSGLAEVSDVLARELPAEMAGWLSFPVDDGAVEAIAARVVAWLQADLATRQEAQRRLVAVVRERWSWEGVARGVLAAAKGELGLLDLPR